MAFEWDMVSIRTFYTPMTGFRALTMLGEEIKGFEASKVHGVNFHARHSSNRGRVLAEEKFQLRQSSSQGRVPAREKILVEANF